MSLWDSVHKCPGCDDYHPMPSCASDAWSRFCILWERLARRIDSERFWKSFNARH